MNFLLDSIIFEDLLLFIDFELVHPNSIKAIVRFKKVNKAPRVSQVYSINRSNLSFRIARDLKISPNFVLTQLSKYIQDSRVK